MMKYSFYLVLVILVLETRQGICQDSYSDISDKCWQGPIDGLRVNYTLSSLSLGFENEPKGAEIIRDIMYVEQHGKKILHMNCMEKCVLNNLTPKTVYCICVKSPMVQCTSEMTPERDIYGFSPLDVLLEKNGRMQHAYNLFARKPTAPLDDLIDISYCQYSYDEDLSPTQCLAIIDNEQPNCETTTAPNGTTTVKGTQGNPAPKWLVFCAKIPEHERTCECLDLREGFTKSDLDITFNFTTTLLDISCDGAQCNNTYQLVIQCSSESFCRTDNPCQENKLYDIEFPFSVDLENLQGTTLDVYILYRTASGAREVIAKRLSEKIYFEDTTPTIEISPSADSVQFRWFRGRFPWAETAISSDVFLNGSPIPLEGLPSHKVVGCDFTFIGRNLISYTNYSWSMNIEIGEETQLSANGTFLTKAASCAPPQDIGVIQRDPQKLTWKKNPKNSGNIECYRIIIHQNKIIKDCYQCDQDQCFFDLPSSLPSDTEISGTVSCRNQGSSEWGVQTKWKNRTEAVVPNAENVILSTANCESQCNNRVNIRIENLAYVRQYGEIIEVIAYYGLWEGTGKRNLTSQSLIAENMKAFSLENLESNSIYQVAVEIHTKAGPSKTRALLFKTSESSRWSRNIFPVLFVTLMTALLIFVSQIAPRHVKLIRLVPSIDLKEIMSKNTLVSHPIKKSDIIKNLKAVLQQKADLQSQFMRIRSSQPDFILTESKASNYTSKNRYANIIPYDNTRVKLNVIPGDVTSSYINASYIDSYHQEMQFIATQGPMKNTVGDFWRMVWQKEIKVIVMLGAFIEKGRDMCFRYWPEENDSNGIILPKEGLQVLGLHTDNENPWIEQEIVLNKMGKEKTIMHAWYNEWFDMGCPNSLHQILHFLHRVKDLAMERGKENHILVHCSAGVGRTGTFIELFNLMDEIEDGASEAIDIASDLLIMRYFRMSMVQTIEQYILIHQCILLHCAEISLKRDELKNEEYEAILSLITVKSKSWAQGQDVLSDGIDGENSLIPFSPEELDEESSIEQTTEKTMLNS